MDNKRKNKLAIVIPAYNEESILNITIPIFLKELNKMISDQLISNDSFILIVDDGSSDKTWDIIKDFSKKYMSIKGIQQSRNRGHQDALIAGMMQVKGMVDAVITIDCDGQDDITAMEKMVGEYNKGNEIVYGVRSNRDTDTAFKKYSALIFYKLLIKMGVETIYNHADYRLVSSKVLEVFEDFKEVNLYLRGLFPLIGFKNTIVYYERKKREAGKTHYPLKKMIGLAFDGITSLSITPIRLIIGIGLFTASMGIIGGVWAIITALNNNTVPGWASIIAIICFLGGIQLFCVGIIGEYIGKTYLEVKHRPRYIISDKVGI